MNEMVTEGLDQAVEALCRRGIEAGEREAEALVAQAHTEASEVLAAARAQAERIVEQAQHEARRTRAQLGDDLRQAASAGVIAMRQAVERSVQGMAIDEALAEVLPNGDMLGRLLTAAVRAFASSREGDADLEVLLPAEATQTLATDLLARAQQVALRGVVLRLEDGVTGGFMLDASGVRLDFSDEALGQVLRRFMAPRFRRYLLAPEGDA